jgi:hypothetical protein
MFIDNLKKIVQDPPCRSSYTTQLLLGRFELDEEKSNEKSCLFRFNAGQESFGATGLLESAIIYTLSSKCLSAHIWALTGDPGVEINVNLTVIKSVKDPSVLLIKTNILYISKRFIFSQVDTLNKDIIVGQYTTQRYVNTTQQYIPEK